MPTKVEIQGFDIFDKIAGEVVEKGMQKHAVFVRDYMKQFAPFGIGTLRESFEITGPFTELDSVNISIESEVEYADIQDKGTFRHMQFQSDAKGGQRSFGELAKSGRTRMQKYRSGYYQARKTGNYQSYKSNYINKALEKAGGDEGLLRRINKEIEIFLKQVG